MRPRLRADLVTNTAEEEGVAYVEVTRPETGSAFRFYDFEYDLALQLDGQPSDAVLAWASEAYGVDLTVGDLDAFVQKLDGLGFLEHGGAAPLPPAASSPAHLPAAASFQEDESQRRDNEKRPDSWGVPAGAWAPLGVAMPRPPESGNVYSSKGGLPSGGAQVGEREDDPLPSQVRPLVSPLPSILAPKATLTPYRPALVASPRQIAPDETPIASIAHAIVSEMDRGAAASEPEATEGSDAATFIWTPQAAAAPSAMRPAARASNTLTAEAAKAANSTEDVTSARGAAALLAGSGSTRGGAPDRAASQARLLDALDEPVASFGERTHSYDSWVDSLRDEIEPPPTAERVAHAAFPAKPASVIPDDDDDDIVSSLRVDGLATSMLASRALDPLAGGQADPRPVHAPGVIVMPALAEPPSGLALPRRRFPAVVAAILVLAAIAAVAWLLWPEGPGTVSSASVPAVHVVSPQPTTIHRWFPTTGVVVPGRDQTLGFAVAGRIQDVLPPGTTFSAGESIARLKGVAERELAVNRLRSRVAFLEQLRNSSRDSGNRVAVRDAEVKLIARKRELAVAVADLSKLEIRPTAPGTIAEVLADAGSLVAARAPALRLRAIGPHAVFALAPNQLSAARELTFCRLETLADPGDRGAEEPGGGGPSGRNGATAVGGALAAAIPAAVVGASGAAAAEPAAAESARRALDCSFPPPTSLAKSSASVLEGPIQPDFEGKLVLGLGSSTTVAPGTPVRLASARFESVFPVPKSAVVHQEGAERVWLVSGSSRKADMRPVEIAATEKDVALISRGVRSGESVIVDPPASLKSGDEVYVVP